MAKEFLSMDGNTAAAYVSYAFTEVAGIYPITPSSNMAEQVDAWASQGRKNLFNSVVKVSEMQSEAGAAGAIHGAIQSGALATTYTASQGLLLMIPTIYKLVGELNPAVLHVSARALATRALSIFGDHQDIYSVRQTGIPMLVSHSVQEVMDLSGIAHLAAIKASVPFLHFFDGFRTSHEIQKIETIDYADLDRLLDKDALKAYKERCLNPHTNPVTRGGAENDDIYFQGREASNAHYDKVADVVNDYMKEISNITGRHYAPFTYYGSENAETIIIAMGSVTDTIRETIDTLNKSGYNVGLVKVHLYRPFSTKFLTDVIPASVKNIAVMDRTKEEGSTGEPLYVDVATALTGKGYTIIGGRYGLGSKDVDPSNIKAVYDHAIKGGKHNFTVGINDDVTNLSIEVDPTFKVEADYTSCLFYGLGSDGTVSANKNSIKIIGDKTDLYAQAYFAYDSKKAGGATRSHLRFGKTPIRSTYYVRNIDFISCSLDSYLEKYDMLANLKEGGTFLLNTTYTKDEIIDHLPEAVKYALASKKAKFFIIDATHIADKIGMGRRTNTILQSAFFALNEQIIPYEKSIGYMKEAANKTYAKKGMDIVELNYKAIDNGKDGLVEIAIDPAWTSLNPTYIHPTSGDDYFDNFVMPINTLQGYDMPVSSFTTDLLINGGMRPDITFNEKRTIATSVPSWIKENCIQCNRCAFVCPHATIRPFLVDEKEKANAPEGLETIAPVGKDMDGLEYTIQVTQENCVGCALCVVECPGKMGNKALEMKDIHEELPKAPVSDYVYTNVTYKTNKYPLNQVKGSQFQKPYFEISGACAGCGETPYYKLMTQYFGKDALIANATGCSSIYCGSTPSTPFVTDENGNGPAWANSLFEDNAEFGYGMRLAQDHKRNDIKHLITENMDSVEAELKDAFTKYLATTSREEEREIAPTIIDLAAKSSNTTVKDTMAKLGQDLVDKSVWIIGGDGWAYDIGYGGLDHVVANDLNVNILVLDTEVYSNTGGQSSKSSQRGSIAKFAASGKQTAKKDLAQICMTYGHVYVAQVSMGANQAQVIKAFQEAESYNGPSLIIAYSPCIEHGIKGGLMNHQITQKKAVECGYFNLFRFDPRLEDAGKNPLQIDGKPANFDLFKDFLANETRFSQLSRVNPGQMDELFEQAKVDAEKRYNRLMKLAQ
ncbi:pyruvate:ferredoxin (flavodoxin) oxidoreductase [Mycoplasma sp. P36-A1]|uniref:pyruvate:ferredoxin (flavodoxin) oxidoreductase n=1 Tax=Mycoplasma sp. P36-A1 TaxID=3252900 RepID=UPI003C2CFB73